MWPIFGKSRSSAQSFPRKRESSVKRYLAGQFPVPVCIARIIPVIRDSHVGWIPACAGMTKVYKHSLVMLFCGALTAGCASTPPAENVLPAGDELEKPAAPVKDAEGKHRYALALMEKEEWQEAVEELEQLTAARPDLSGPWVNLGIARTMLGQGDAAEVAFEQALEANSRNAEAWNQLGILYRRSNRLEKARAAYTKGLEHAPDHADLHWNLALLHDVHLPDPALALQHFERYRELTGTDDPQLQQWIARLRELVPPEDPAKMTAGAKK